jgi:hypothetical protein
MDRGNSDLSVSLIEDTFLLCGLLRLFLFFRPVDER